MSLTVQTAPNTAPLSTAEAKAHLRVDGSDEDTLIDAYVDAAREYIEARYRLVLTTGTWDFTPETPDGLERDDFPSGLKDIECPLHPLQSVESITYVDTDGASQTLSSSNYVVVTGATPGRIRLAYDKCWPDTRKQPNAVVVRAKFGYGDAATAVPESILCAVRLIVGHFHEHREQFLVEGMPREIPTADLLLRGKALLEVA